MASLRVTNGPGAGLKVEITSELVIGREHAELTIDDPEISRRHAVVRRAGGALEVEDLGSSNGTFVNGERIRGTVRLGGGAKIRLGSTVLEIQAVPGAETTRLRPIATQTPAREAETQFRPPSHRRSRRVASRSWVPVALSYGTVVLTAVALVVYFASR